MASIPARGSKQALTLEDNEFSVFAHVENKSHVTKYVNQGEVLLFLLRSCNVVVVAAAASATGRRRRRSMRESEVFRFPSSDPFKQGEQSGKKHPAYSAVEFQQDLTAICSFSLNS